MGAEDGQIVSMHTGAIAIVGFDTRSRLAHLLPYISFLMFCHRACYRTGSNTSETTLEAGTFRLWATISMTLANRGIDEWNSREDEFVWPHCHFGHC